jgi:hypothetical protein
LAAHSSLVAGAVLLELCQAVDDATLAALVGGTQAPLAAWLTAPPTDASPDALLLALRLWPRLPAAWAEACPLLPAGFAAKKLPAQLFADPSASAGSKAVAAVAAAFFSKQHLTSLLPVLRGTTQSHPRLHSVWPTLLALLIPGFTADKVSNSETVLLALLSFPSGVLWAAAAMLACCWQAGSFPNMPAARLIDTCRSSGAVERGAWVRRALLPPPWRPFGPVWLMGTWCSPATSASTWHSPSSSSCCRTWGEAQA